MLAPESAAYVKPASRNSPSASRLSSAPGRARPCQTRRGGAPSKLPRPRACASPGRPGPAGDSRVPPMTAEPENPLRPPRDAGAGISRGPPACHRPSLSPYKAWPRVAVPADCSAASHSMPRRPRDPPRAVSRFGRFAAPGTSATDRGCPVHHRHAVSFLVTALRLPRSRAGHTTRAPGST